MSTPLAPLSADERENFSRRMTSLGGASRLFPDIDAVLEKCAADSVRLLAERDSLERERDEARAQIFAAHAERNEADRDLAVAQEQVRSLSRAREALAAYFLSEDEWKTKRQNYRQAEADYEAGETSESWLEQCEADEADAREAFETAKAALRAALAEPLGGP